MPLNPITVAFVEAAERLGVAFEPDFQVRLTSGGVLKSLGRLRDFGSSNGTLIFDEASALSPNEIEDLRASGYFLSRLFASYAMYEELHFKDTLNDWQYFGTEANRPGWYTGKAWTL